MMRRFRFGFVLLCLLLALLPAVPGAAAAAAKTPKAAQRSQPAAPAEIVVTGITPKSPGPKSTVQITGTVTNRSKHPLGAVYVRLRFSTSPLVTRTQLTQFAEGLLPARVFPLPETLHQVATDLAPQATARWRIKIRTADLGLNRFGVYPLAIEALGSGYQQLTAVRTFLPYVPTKPRRPKPTKVAWLWPVVDRPHRITGETFFDDTLSKSLAAEGRLGRLVRIAAQSSSGDGSVPLTYAIDPQLLQDAQAMSDGYQVRRGGETERRDGSDTAAQWLDEVRSVTDGAPTIALPYADPDMTALTHAGLDDNLTFAVTTGETLAEDILGRDVSRDVAWPLGGMVDQDTLDNLVVAGTRTVVLADTAVPTAQPLTYTPDALASVPTIAGAVRVLVADSTVSGILGRDTWSPGSAVLTEQRFLAETALITAERPSQQRTLLIAPPRRWNPHPSFATGVLADTAKVPWLEPVSLSELVETSEPVPRAPLRYPRVARSRELPGEYLDHVKGMNRDVQQLTSIVTPPSSDFHLALLRAESSAWRRSPELREKFRRTLRAALDAQLGQVKILSRAPRTLASTSGTVPVTIANELEDHSVTVGLRVTPRNRARLEIGDYPRRVSVGPERKETVQVPMEARAIGVTTVELQLMTPSGEPYGKPIELTVRATGYGTVALFITAGAVAVLCLAISVRIVRRALRGDDEEGEDDSGESADDAATEQGQDTDAAATGGERGHDLAREEDDDRLGRLISKGPRVSVAWVPVVRRPACPNTRLVTCGNPLVLLVRLSMVRGLCCKVVRSRHEGEGRGRVGVPFVMERPQRCRCVP